MIKYILTLVSISKALDLIADCGAAIKIGPNASVNETWHNKEALESCLTRANASSTDKVVKLPKDIVV